MHQIVLSLLLSFALCLSSGASWAQGRSVVRIATPFVEAGKPVTLEMVIYKPDGTGPFPTVMFNHGSTGIGNDPSLFRHTWAPQSLAHWFTERGWLVAFPQRRGRGQSDGLYDEGFNPQRSRYSCDPVLSLAGLEHALSDLDAAAAWLKASPEVDPTRMVIAGQSRGGILAVAYAGSRPDVSQGVINFVGGWMSERCGASDAKAINTVTFKRGAGFTKPMLWLYAENDSYYSMAHSRTNFAAFTSAGGKGNFESYSLKPGVNGHLLFLEHELWGKAVEDYLKR